MSELIISNIDSKSLLKFSDLLKKGLFKKVL